MPHKNTKEHAETLRLPENAKQAPFRQITLLTSGSFISYCDRNNARTSEKELEKLCRILVGKEYSIPQDNSRNDNWLPHLSIIVPIPHGQCFPACRQALS